MAGEVAALLAAQLRVQWRSGVTPDVFGLLHEQPTFSPEDYLLVILTDQEERLRGGAPLAAEEYFEAFPDLAADAGASGRVVQNEYTLAQRRGAAPDLAEFWVRFPHLAGSLARCIIAAATTVQLDGQSASDEEPQILPTGYELIREIGAGACGRVWLAEQRVFGRWVAIKMLRRRLHTPNGWQQLVSEAKAMAGLPSHSHRVTVYDLVESDGNTFLVMEYVDGGSLAALIGPNQPLAWDRAVRYVAQVADGLADLHSQGHLHYDIKPSNLLLTVQRGCSGTP